MKNETTPPMRRQFLKLAGASAAGSMLAGASGRAAAQAVPSPQIQALQAYLRANASPTTWLPSAPAVLPIISWAGALTGWAAATSLPNGVIVPASSPLIGGPARHRYTASLPGNPMVAGYPCRVINRPFTCKGISRATSSPTVLRVRTDAPVLELTGVVADGSATVQTLIVDGELVPAKVLVSSRGAGGWNFGTVRIDFGTRATRDIWIETALAVAYLKISPQDVLLPVDDSADPQITVVGDSYLAVPSGAFGNGSAIALELAARLGLRKVTVDGIGGTGYWNSGYDLGNLNDRLPAHAPDNSTIYLILAGLNDYADITGNRLVWPTRATYEQAVRGYLQNLRAAQPNALIAVTAPFCPIPPMSDGTYVANGGTNSSGEGDFLYRAHLFKSAVQQIAGPWIYIDVLMGTGWLNSSGATGDVTNLQWFTGGTPAPGTSPTYRPGNTNGGGGGGYGGIESVQVLNGGRYSQAPEVEAIGGSGTGLLLSSRIDAAGRIVAVTASSPGQGYSPGPGMPTLKVSTTYQITPAVLGSPVLQVGTNPNGQYPLPSFAPPGLLPSKLNNIYAMLRNDTVHPSPMGVSYLSTRLARDLFDAVMAL